MFSAAIGFLVGVLPFVVLGWRMYVQFRELGQGDLDRKLKQRELDQTDRELDQTDRELDLKERELGLEEQEPGDPDSLPSAKPLDELKAMLDAEPNEREKKRMLADLKDLLDSESGSAPKDDDEEGDIGQVSEA